VYERERLWQETAVAQSKVLSRHLPAETEENHKNSAMIACLRAEIWTRDLRNTKQDCRVNDIQCDRRKWNSSRPTTTHAGCIGWHLRLGKDKVYNHKNKIWVPEESALEIAAQVSDQCSVQRTQNEYDGKWWYSHPSCLTSQVTKVVNTEGAGRTTEPVWNGAVKWETRVQIGNQILAIKIKISDTHTQMSSLWFHPDVPWKMRGGWSNKNKRTAMVNEFHFWGKHTCQFSSLCSSTAIMLGWIAEAQYTVNKKQFTPTILMKNT
jgi:hypothetical protein